MEEGDLAAGKSTAAACGGWIVFEAEAGQSMTPPRARSWGRKGRTPVVRVRGRGSGRLSMAGLTCYKPGKRSRIFYSMREYRGRRGEPKGIGWRDLRDQLVRAHIQLGGPIVLVWDNPGMHLVEPMRQFIADQQSGSLSSHYRATELEFVMSVSRPRSAPCRPGSRRPTPSGTG
ncbi:hypothetical protein AB0O12_38825, partial [Kitasatospora griseola]